MNEFVSRCQKNGENGVRFSSCLIHPLAAALALTLGASAAHAQNQPLNDTGVTFSADDTGNSTICEDSAPETQDCHNGRDFEAAAGVLPKVGASTPNNGVPNGFDYTKISNTGSVLPASATLGTGAGDWACTRDNVTGLLWEVKTTSGLRDMDYTYTWYDSNSPDGNPGTESGGSCYQAGRCDTEKFVQDVNTAGLCGYSDWRMPGLKELFGLSDLGRGDPAIDPGYYPNTPSSFTWSGSPYANSSDSAWFVSFGGGLSDLAFRFEAHSVRLVRGGL